MKPFSKILALDPGGTPTSWISYHKAVLHVLGETIAWIPEQAQEHRLFGGTNAITGLQSYIDIHSIIAIKSPMAAKIDHRAAKIPAVSNRVLFCRDFYRCAYCGKYFDHDELTRDHIIPKSKGGKNTWDNIITACKGCNGKKRDRTPEKAGMLLRFKPYTPTRLQSLSYSNKHPSPEQIEYLEMYGVKAGVRYN